MTDIRESLPVHDDGGPSRRGEELALHIDGLVRRALRVCAADLALLPRIDHVAPFTCEEGWTVPAVRWRGVRLGDVVALAEPLSSARYVRVHAGDYVVPVSLSGAQALICDEMNDLPLSRAHGAPWRLLVPGGACFTSVKWVDRLEVAATPGESRGERMARARLTAVRETGAPR